MYIVIFGANKLSAYIASILSQESHGVFLIDNDQHELDKISSELDISTVVEDEHPWILLDKLTSTKPDAVLALTDNDERNLTLCKIAKNLHYPMTVALVNNENYINSSKLNFNEIFSVDFFICPNILVSQEIFKFIVTPKSTGAENFAHGAIHMHTMKVPEKWKNKKCIHQLNLPEGLMLGLIRRSVPEAKNEFDEKELIFPHGKDVLYSNDEVTFIGKPDAINSLNDFFDVPSKQIKAVAIVGGTPIAINLARILSQRNIKTTIIEEDEKKCQWLSDKLQDSTIMNQDGCNSQFMQIEQMGKMDAIVACTNHDEINILACSLGKSIGCEKTIASIGDIHFSSIIEQAKIDHYVSPREAIANRILSIIQKHKVIAVASLYENQAKIMELKVSYSSPLAGIPIYELGMYLPNDFLFAAIQNRGKIMIADGTKVLCPGDTVVVITHPEHYNSLQKLF